MIRSQSEEKLQMSQSKVWGRQDGRRHSQVAELRLLLPWAPGPPSLMRQRVPRRDLSLRGNATPGGAGRRKPSSRFVKIFAREEFQRERAPSPSNESARGPPLPPRAGEDPAIVALNRQPRLGMCSFHSVPSAAPQLALLPAFLHLCHLFPHFSYPPPNPPPLQCCSLAEVWKLAEVTCRHDTPRARLVHGGLCGCRAGGVCRTSGVFFKLKRNFLKRKRAPPPSHTHLRTRIHTCSCPDRQTLLVMAPWHERTGSVSAASARLFILRSTRRSPLSSPITTPPYLLLTSYLTFRTK